MAPLPTEAFRRALPALNTESLHKLSALATLALLIGVKTTTSNFWQNGNKGALATIEGIGLTMTFDGPAAKSTVADEVNRGRSSPLRGRSISMSDA